MNLTPLVTRLSLVCRVCSGHAESVFSVLSWSRFDLCLILVAAAWGSTYLVAKELIGGGAVLVLLASRMLFAAAALGLLMGLRRRAVTSAEWRVGFVLGLLLAGIFLLETFGIAHTSATNAGLIISLTIVFTPLLDAAVSKRRLAYRFLLASGVAVVGVSLLASNGALQPPALGDVLVLGAAIIRAVHVTSMHKLTAGRQLDSMRLTTVQMSTCAVVFSVITLFHGQSVPRYLSRFDLGSAALFVYLVLVCTVFAFLVQTWAVRQTSPARVSLLLGTEPVWAAVVGIMIAGDAIGLAGAVGIILILVGTAWGRAIDQRTHTHEHATARPGDGAAPSERPFQHLLDRPPIP